MYITYIYISIIKEVFFTYIYRYTSCFCEIWALCVSWITYDYLYYTPCLACWVLFGSLVPSMCNGTSCAQVHVSPQSHCGDNPEGTLLSWVHIYYARLASVRFEHCVSWITYEYWYYPPCLACWALFGSLVPAMCNITVHHVP